MTSTAATSNTAYRAAMYATRLSSGEIRCELCPHRCVLDEGRPGLCRVRFNQAGTLTTSTYGRLVVPPARDAVENKPFYHLTPGRPVTTVGGVGCTMACPYCYNWPLVFCAPDTTYLSVDQLRDTAVAHGSNTVVFAYNEPIVAAEYILDASHALHEAGLLTAAVTNGFVERQPLQDLLSALDAVLVDVKDARSGFYSESLHGDLDVVWSTIEQARRKTHLEVKWVVLPGRQGDVEPIAERLADIDREIPLHIWRYYPHYQWTESPTPIRVLRECWERASRLLSFVYSPELGDDSATVTRCPECSQRLISREPGAVRSDGLANKNQCRQCGKTIPLLGVS